MHLGSFNYWLNDGRGTGEHCCYVKTWYISQYNVECINILSLDAVGAACIMKPSRWSRRRSDLFSWPTVPRFLRFVLVHVYLWVTMFNSCTGSQSKHVVELQNCINAPYSNNPPLSLYLNLSFTLSQYKWSCYNLTAFTFLCDMFIGIATNIYCDMGNGRVSGFCTVTTRNLRVQSLGLVSQVRM